MFHCSHHKLEYIKWNILILLQTKIIFRHCANFYNLYILYTSEYKPLLPIKYYLFPNYSNLFNVTTTINCHILEVSKVFLKIYKVCERVVTELVKKLREQLNIKLSETVVNTQAEFISINSAQDIIPIGRNLLLLNNIFKNY